MEFKKGCLNSHHACQNQAIYIKAINSSNFCSIKCFKEYIGEKKPVVPERKIFNDPERQKQHDLYIWALGGKKPEWVTKCERRPKPEEWLVNLSKNTPYLWDDFDRRHVVYVLGKGIFDDLGKLIVDENSEYYRQLIKRFDEVQYNYELINKDVTAPTKKRGVKRGTKRGPYKERIKLTTITCKGCGRTIRVTSKRKKQFCSESCRRRYWRNHKKGKG